MYLTFLCHKEFEQTRLIETNQIMNSVRCRFKCEAKISSICYQDRNKVTVDSSSTFWKGDNFVDDFC